MTSLIESYSFSIFGNNQLFNALNEVITSIGYKTHQNKYSDDVTVYIIDTKPSEFIKNINRFDMILCKVNNIAVFNDFVNMFNMGYNVYGFYHNGKSHPVKDIYPKDLRSISQHIFHIQTKTLDTSSESELYKNFRKIIGKLYAKPNKVRNENIFNQYFDAIYIINSRESPKNIFYTKSLIDSLNIQYVPVKTFKEAIEDALENKYIKILILQNGCIFKKDIVNNFASLVKQINRAWDILYLGSTQLKYLNGEQVDIKFVSDNAYKAHLTGSSFAIALDASTYNRFLESPHESELINAQKDTIALVASPPLFIHFPKDIEMDYANRYVWDISKYEISLNKSNRELFIKYMNEKYIDQFRNYVKDKRIAIVGPASSAKHEANGTYIDSFDIVVRINKQWRIPPDLHKYVGKRVDILYHCLNFRETCGGELNYPYLKKTVKYIVSPYPFINNDKHRDTMFHGEYQLEQFYRFYMESNGIPFLPISNKLYNEVDKHIQTRMNSGFSAIIHLLSLPIKELYIKGFSFFLDGYMPEYRGDFIYNDYMKRNHDQLRQFKLFKSILEKDSRVKVDKVLQYIIENAKPENFF